jgi:hypothetical protein
MRVDEFTPQKTQESGKILQINFHKRFTFLLFEKQIRMYLEEKFSDKDYISVSGDFEGGSLQVW